MGLEPYFSFASLSCCPLTSGMEGRSRQDAIEVWVDASALSTWLPYALNGFVTLREAIV